jgi:phosphatidylglycerophosphate synthase
VFAVSDVPYLAKAGALFALVLAVALPRVRAHHPHRRFGAANQVTTIRAALAALAAGLIGEPHAPAVPMLAIALGALATALDAVDGWLARRSRMQSAFGARFDLEVDALLILVLSILAWRYGKAGVWVLAAGLTRYAFVAAGRIWPWLRRPLPGTLRGKAICVVQIGGLLVALVPSVQRPWSAAVAAASIAALWYSFVVDTRSLWQRRLHE